MVDALAVDDLREEPYEVNGVPNYMAYVAFCQSLGFDKVTIIDRASWQPVGYSATTDIATAWTDPEGTAINENQELLNDWADASRPAFHFYQGKYNIILREPDGTGAWIVCQTGKRVVVACKFPTIYFIASGLTKSKGKAVDGETGFPGAPGALSAIQGKLWDAMNEKIEEDEA